MNLPARCWMVLLLGWCLRAAAAEAAPTLLNEYLQKQFAAASAWDLGGQFRIRYEVKENAGSFPSRDFIRHGQDNGNDYLLLREKFHVGYTPESWVQVYAEGRDSRAFFDKREPSPEQDELDLHQAFVRIGDPKLFPLAAKIGRQELNYGDERFVGIADWGNTQRTFDAAKVRFENERLWIDAFAGRVVISQDDHFNVANDYDWFWGAYASSQTILPKHESQLFFLGRNVTDKSPRAITPSLGGPGARDIYTPGLRLRSLPKQLGALDYGAELAGQFGSINSGPGRTRHEAFAADALIGHTWESAWGAPRLGIEYTYASGDHDPNDRRHQTFELLFGTNHRLYGIMDLFGLRNTHNPSVSFSIKPVNGLSLRADYLLFWLADTHDFLYPESASQRSGNGYGLHPQFHSFVGSELDLTASYQVTRWAELQCGYGHFFVGDYIRQSVETVPANGGATDADWVYMQLKLSF